MAVNDKGMKENIEQNMKIAKDILDFYLNKMDPIQQEAFLLGRIYTLLNDGNSVALAFNNAIKDSDKELAKVQKVINAAKPIPKKKAPAKKTTAKEKSK